MGKHGTIRIHVNELIKQKGISKNKLSQRAESAQKWSVRSSIITVTTRFPDYVDVLARLCAVLECGIGDPLEYVPPEK